MEFNLSSRPRLAGSYFNWESEPPAAAPPVGTGAIVAIVGTHDWGPIAASKVFTDLDAFDRAMGSDDTSGRRAARRAFLGQGLPGRGGAGGVLFIREATPAAAPATRQLLNTGGLPALTLTARYSGTRGNRFAFTVQPSAQGGGLKDLIVLDGARVVATYTFTGAVVQDFVDAINARDGFFTAVVDNDGTAIADVSSAQAAGGADGDVLTATEHTAAQAILDASRFGVFAPANLTDTAIRASYIAWQAQSNALGKRIRSVFGGLAGESLATANGRSQGINDFNVVNLGVGTLHDDVHDVDVSTAELAPAVAGALAARGESKDLIFTRFGWLSVPDNAGLPSLTDQVTALGAGTTVFTRDTTATAPVFIREGVTTYSDDSASPVDADGNKLVPAYDAAGNKAFASVKNIAIQQGIETAVDEWATSGDVLGDVPVNDRTRALVLGQIVTEYATREALQIVQPGWTVGLDPSVAVSDDDDFIAYVHGFHPTRSLRQMFNSARVG